MKSGYAITFISSDLVSESDLNRISLILQFGILCKVLQIQLSYMAKKLYVGGLPYSTSNDELKAHFSTAGEVSSATIIMDKMTNRSKGFGFVEFENDADAEQAISMFDGKDFGGRKLTVNEARPMEERPRNFQR